MARLGITVLGPFGAALDGQAITGFGSNKVRALLAYLAVEARRSQSREALAALLWPDWPHPSALGSLRYVLSDLRKNIGDRESPTPFLLIEHNSIQLNPGSDCRVDLREFENLVLPQLQVRDLHPQTIEQLKSAMDLYQGPFLEGFSLPDSAPFEEWLTLTRERLNREMMGALQHLVSAYEQRRAFDQALPFAYRQVELEPWREDAHQQIMRLLAYSGQRSAALAQFESCVLALKSELDIEPGADTLTLYEAIRTETLEFSASEERYQDLPPATGQSPYKGLQYFDEADAGLFFGREGLTARLVEHVMQIAAGPTDESNLDLPRVLAVVGASGSGKSSLVRAGLAPALRRELLHQRKQRPTSKIATLQIHIFTPTAHPLEPLALALPRAAVSPVGQMDVLMIDQFEELFTLCHNEAERITFLDHLLARGSSQLLVILVLRADFYAHCARYPRLRQALSSHQEYIGPMSAAELRRAIEGPAQQSGWELEPGLMELILRDVGAGAGLSPEPGALPLLEHALLETWQRRSGKTLTLRGYTASGGVRGAIAHTAESVLHSLTLEQQGQARRIFLRLTELGEGTQDTRRRVALAELLPEAGDTQGVEGLLKELADARLITLSEDSVEVAHEALIREWPVLRTWLSEDREGLRLHRHLTETAQEWLGLDKDSAELYRGARLAQAVEWAAQPDHAVELNALESEFLNASQARAVSEAEEREAQRQRELIAAQQLAETEKRRAAEQAAAARRLRQRAIFLAAVAFLAALLAVAAVLIAISANNNARLANARQLASAAEAGLQVDSGQSISLALQSLQTQPLVDTYSVLHRALFASHVRSSVLAHRSDAGYIAINTAGDRLATIGGDSRLKVWRINGTEIDPSPASVIENTIPYGSCKEAWSNKLAFIPHSSLVAVVYCEFYVSLVDARTGQIVRKLQPSWKNGTTGLAGSPDGKWIAAFNGDGQVAIWDLASGENLLTFQAYEPIPNGMGMTCLDFSPLGHQLATGGKNGEVKIWDLEQSQNGLQATLIAQANQQNEDFVQSIHYDSDGQRLADATLNSIHLLNLVSTGLGIVLKESLAIPLNANIRINSLFYSPAGDRLVTDQLGNFTNGNNYKSSGNGIQIWDTATGRLLDKIVPQEQLLSGVMSADGQRFFTSHLGGEIHAWDISNLGSPERLAIPGVGSDDGLNLSQDGRRLLIVNQLDLNNGSYSFYWDQADGNHLISLKHFTITLGVQQARVMVSKDLTRIMILDPQNLCRVFDAETGELLSQFQVGHAGSDGVVFGLSPDGKQIFMQTNSSETEDGVEIWDIPTARRLYRILPKDSGFNSIFAPDGNNLITFGSNNAINLILWWDPVTGQTTRKLDGQNGVLSGIIITPDQKYVLSWGEDQTVKIHEVVSGRLVRTLSPGAQINSVIVSPDSKTAAVSMTTFQTTLYSLEDGHEQVTLPGSSIVFLPDRPAVLNSTPDDSTVYAFTLDNSDLVRLACERLKNITSSNGAPTTPLKICQ